MPFDITKPGAEAMNMGVIYIFIKRQIFWAWLSEVYSFPPFLPPSTYTGLKNVNFVFSLSILHPLHQCQLLSLGSQWAGRGVAMWHHLAGPREAELGLEGAWLCNITPAGPREGELSPERHHFLTGEQMRVHRQGNVWLPKEWPWTSCLPISISVANILKFLQKGLWNISFT